MPQHLYQRTMNWRNCFNLMRSRKHSLGKALNGYSSQRKHLGMAGFGNASLVLPSPPLRRYSAELQSTCALFKQLLLKWRQFLMIAPWPMFPRTLRMKGIKPRASTLWPTNHVTTTPTSREWRTEWSHLSNRHRFTEEGKTCHLTDSTLLATLASRVPHLPPRVPQKFRNQHGIREGGRCSSNPRWQPESKLETSTCHIH